MFQHHHFAINDKPALNMVADLGGYWPEAPMLFETRALLKVCHRIAWLMFQANLSTRARHQLILETDQVGKHNYFVDGVSPYGDASRTTSLNPQPLTW